MMKMMIQDLSLQSHLEGVHLEPERLLQSHSMVSMQTHETQKEEKEKDAVRLQ